MRELWKERWRWRRGATLRFNVARARVALAERDALAIFGLTFHPTVFQSNVESITRMPRACVFVFSSGLLKHIIFHGLYVVISLAEKSLSLVS